MIGHALIPIIHGTLNALTHTWYLFLPLLAAKMGPRVVRGFMVRRGGIR